MDSRRFASGAWVAAWGVAAIFALLASSIHEPPHRLEYARLVNRLGLPLRVVVFVPQPAKFDRAPAAIVCQPLNNPAEYGRMLALELVQDGFVVLTFDWHGQVPAENRQLLRVRTQETLRADLAAAVADLRRRPEVNPERVMVAGHSVGGTLAIEAALADPTIAAVASIGMDADVSPSQPRNLLWVLGLYDEFRSLGEMRGGFEQSAPRGRRRTLEGVTVGDFAAGTARRLGVSPTSDHFTELQDSGIHREVLDWFRLAAGLGAESRPLRMEYRGLLVMLAFLTALVAALLTLRRLLAARWVTGSGRNGVLPAAVAIALAGIVVLARLSTHGRFLMAADGIMALVAFALLAAPACAVEAKTLRRAGRNTLRVGLVLWASVLLTLLANNVPYYAQNPRDLAAFPEFAVLHPLDLAYAYLLVYPRPLLFSVYGPEGIAPRWWVYATLGIEVVFSGTVLAFIANLARRPRSAALGGVKSARPAVSLIVLLVLTGFLAGVLWLRLEQGFLTGESARTGLRFLLRFAVPPFFIFVLLWRCAGRTRGPTGRVSSGG